MRREVGNTFELVYDVLGTLMLLLIPAMRSVQ